MKSTSRTIIVECKFRDKTDTKQYSIDTEVFDDVYLEATTRYIEEHIKKENDKITPIISAYDKKDIKNFDKHYCYNTYFIMINAGYHIKAEIMRKNFKEMSGIDLKIESIGGIDDKKIKNGKSSSNN